MSIKRFPIAPLLAIQPSVAELSRLAGVDRSLVNRAVQAGSVTWMMADRLAVACGVHPGCLWADWWPPEEGAAAKGKRSPSAAADENRQKALESLRACMWAVAS